MATTTAPRAMSNTIRSAGAGVVATASRTLHGAMEKAEAAASQGWNARALGVVKFVAMFGLPVLGMGVAYQIDKHHNAKVETNKKEVLAQYYRNQIGAQLRIDPTKVNASHLDLINPNSAIGTAVAKVKHERKDANRSAALSSGAAAAATAFVPLPGMGAVAHMAASTGVHMAGAVAGSVVASAFSKDILHTHDVMEHLDEKLAKRQALTAGDIVTLRISKDERLQHDLKKKNGVAFHKMTEAQQRAVLVGMPDMRDAGEIAEKVNSGQMHLQDALMVTETKPTSWAQRIGGPRAAQSSFVAQETARRANVQGTFIS